MIVLFTFIGILIGFFVGYLVGKPKAKDEKYSRRGLYETSYTVNSTSESVEVTFEIGEIEATDTLSKVKVLSVKTNRSEYNNSDMQLRNIKSMINESWIESSKVNWITTVAQKRNEKIDQILN